MNACPTPVAENASSKEMTLPITVVVCTSRVEILSRHWMHNLKLLGHCDRLLVVMDISHSPYGEEFVDMMEHAGAWVVVNGANYGLSQSRNIALELCDTKHILFIDDDVTLVPGTLPAVRAAFAAGAGIVGVRIRAPMYWPPRPWYISQGQLHYLAIHNDRAHSTWGACMGFEVALVRRFRLTFRHELGRHGRNLASADDTTFVGELRAYGAEERFLNDAFVHHNVAEDRFGLPYVMRRAYWQGRSEVRRRNLTSGLQKEWRRNWSEARGLSRLILAPLYMICVAAGVAREALSSTRGECVPKMHSQARGRGGSPAREVNNV